jgi:FixJ family two-component response regulator
MMPACETMAEQGTVFIVDDDPAACESVAALAESMETPCETFDSAEAFLDRYRPELPGCLVTDVRMPGMSGLELQEQLVDRGVDLPVVVITAYGDVPLAVRAMHSGAMTVLEKPCGKDVLWESIRAALERDRAMRKKAGREREVRQRLAELTPKERHVLALIVAGVPNKSIAAQLDIGLRTVEKRRHVIFRKMGAKSLPELVQIVAMVEE